MEDGRLQETGNATSLVARSFHKQYQGLLLLVLVQSKIHYDVVVLPFSLAWPGQLGIGGTGSIGDYIRQDALFLVDRHLRHIMRGGHLKVFWRARKGAIFFIIFQQIVFVDISTNWNDSWVEKSNAARVDQGESGFSPFSFRQRLCFWYHLSVGASQGSSWSFSRELSSWKFCWSASFWKWFKQHVPDILVPGWKGQIGIARVLVTRSMGDCVLALVVVLV